MVCLMVCLMVLFNEIILYLYGLRFRPDRGQKIVRSVHIRWYIYTQSERFTIRHIADRTGIGRSQTRWRRKKLSIVRRQTGDKTGLISTHSDSAGREISVGELHK